MYIPPKYDCPACLGAPLSAVLSEEVEDSADGQPAAAADRTPAQAVEAAAAPPPGRRGTSPYPLYDPPQGAVTDGESRGGGGGVRESSGAVYVLCGLSVVWAVTDGESGGGGVPSDSRRVRCMCCVISVWCGRSQTVRAGTGGVPSESRRVRCVCYVVSVWCGRSQTVRAGTGGGCRQTVVGCGVCAMWSQCGVGGHRR